MKKTLTELLVFLYGDEKAKEVEVKIHDLIEKYRPQISYTRKNGYLDQRDAILITYADQVSSEGEEPLRTFEKFSKKYLQNIISGIHILPFYPFSSDDGFSVMDYCEVNPNFGTWENLKTLGQDFDLMFDAVVNHVSAKGVWFQKFLEGDEQYEKFFITVDDGIDLSEVFRPRTSPLLTSFETAKGVRKVWTTFSADQIDLNFENPEVFIAIMDVILFYIANGARFIRLDAITFLWKKIGTNCIHLPETHAAIQAMRLIAEKAAPHVRLISETNVPHKENISYFGDGFNEAHMVYNFALAPLTLHALCTKKSRVLGEWIETLEPPSKETTFFNFLASHDGIAVGPVRGILEEEEILKLTQKCEKHNGKVSYKTNSNGSQSPYEMNVNYFDALSDPNDVDEPTNKQVDRFMAAQAIMLSLDGVPGIYFHSLFGSRNNCEEAERTGIARKINREKLSYEKIDQELKDEESLRSKVFSRYCELLKTRNEQTAFAPGTGQKVIFCDDRVLVLKRKPDDERECVWCVHNISDEEVKISIPVGKSAHYKDLLGAHEICVDEAGQVINVMLKPYGVSWIKG